VLGRARREGRRTVAVNGRAMSGVIPLRLIYLRCGQRRFVPIFDVSNCKIRTGLTATR
jgi:hypothetical protein